MPAEMILFGGSGDGVVIDAHQADSVTLDLGFGPEVYRRTRTPDNFGREIIAQRDVYAVMYGTGTGSGGGPHGPA